MHSNDVLKLNNEKRKLEFNFSSDPTYDVELMTYKDINPYIKYVELNYGKDYLKSLKI